MTKILSTSILIAICVLTVCCNSAPNKLPETHNYQLTQKYTDDTNNFSIQLPENWETHPKYDGNVLMANGPFLTNSQTQMTRAGAFAIRIVEMPIAHSTEVFYNGNLNPIKEEYKDFRIIEEYDIDINGISAKYISHSLTVNEIPATNVQIYFCKDKRGFILNGSAVTEDFATYRDLYIEIASTFMLM